MEQKNTTVFYNGMIWGLILGIVSIIYSVLLYMADQYGNQLLGYLGMAITVIVMIFAMRSYRDQVLGGVMPFGKAFGFGIVAILVSALLSGIFGYILFTVIDTGLVDKVRDATMEKAVENPRGGATPEMIEQGFEMMSFMFKPLWMTIMGFISSAFMGAILSLILAAIFKKEQDPLADLAEAEGMTEEP